MSEICPDNVDYNSFSWILWNICSLSNYNCKLHCVRELPGKWCKSLAIKIDFPSRWISTVLNSFSSFDIFLYIYFKKIILAFLISTLSTLFATDSSSFLFIPFLKNDFFIHCANFSNCHKFLNYFLKINKFGIVEKPLTNEILG